MNADAGVASIPGVFSSIASEFRIALSSVESVEIRKSLERLYSGLAEAIKELRDSTSVESGGRASPAVKTRQAAWSPPETIPEEFVIDPKIVLSPVEQQTFEQLLEDPAAPSEALRKLFHGLR